MFAKKNLQIEVLSQKFRDGSGFIPGGKCKCLKATVANWGISGKRCKQTITYCTTYQTILHLTIPNNCCKFKILSGGRCKQTLLYFMWHIGISKLWQIQDKWKEMQANFTSYNLCHVSHWKLWHVQDEWKKEDASKL